MNESRKLVIECSDSPGLLIRTVLILERRGYRMDSFKIERNNAQSRMFISINGEEHRFEQVKKQISRLIDVSMVTEVE